MILCGETLGFLEFKEDLVKLDSVGVLSQLKREQINLQTPKISNNIALMFYR